MSGFFVSCIKDKRLINSWAGSTLQVAHASGTHTWRFSSRFIDLDATAYEVATDIVAFLNTSYGGGLTFSFAVTSTTTGKGFTFTGSESVTWTASSYLQALLGIAASTSSATLSTGSSSAVVGGWKGTIGMDGFIRHDAEDGIGGRFGGYMPGHPATAPRSPTFYSVISESELIALSDVMMVSSSPRRATVYEEHTATWRAVTLGRVTVERLSLTHYSLSGEVLG